jgi:hypothetical protein
MWRQKERASESLMFGEKFAVKGVSWQNFAAGLLV